MITEDYISFETAKLLKEKWFDEECRAFYVKSKECGIELFPAERSRNYNDNIYPRISAPTLQMAMKWLRETHKLFIQICIIPHTTITIEQKYYLFTIHKDRRTLAFRKDFPSEYYFTYEEACETAIKYCLENLI